MELTRHEINVVVLPMHRAIAFLPHLIHSVYRLAQILLLLCDCIAEDRYLNFQLVLAFQACFKLGEVCLVLALALVHRLPVYATLVVLLTLDVSLQKLVFVLSNG